MCDQAQPKHKLRLRLSTYELHVLDTIIAGLPGIHDRLQAIHYAIARYPQVDLVEKLGLSNHQVQLLRAAVGHQNYPGALRDAIRMAIDLLETLPSGTP
jgi:hypothetical protein